MGSDDAGKAPALAPHMLAKALLNGFLLLLLQLAVLFLPSGAWGWWQAWWCTAAQGCLLWLPGFWVIARTNPCLIAERMKFLAHHNTAWFERLLVPPIAASLPVLYLAAGLQHQPRAPRGLDAPTAVAMALQAATLLLLTWTITTNRFYSSVVRIQSDRQHTVCRSGPYAACRHPSYVLAALLGGLEAVVLQSSWAAWVAAARTVLLLVRTVLEDAMLQRELPGYSAYARDVRAKWVPGVW